MKSREIEKKKKKNLIGGRIIENLSQEFCLVA